MGWLSMTATGMAPFTTPTAYLDAQFTWSRDIDGELRGLRLLRSACPGNRVYYAAAQPYTKDGPGAVFAIICLIRWTPRAADGFIFAYKDMDETVGPYEIDCPEAILSLLGPTDYPNAIEWRERCYARLKLRERPLNGGDIVKFDQPLTFSDGKTRDTFEVVKRGARIRFRDTATGEICSITGFRERAWTIQPKTRVFATLFAPTA